ncbi:Dynein alpha chain, flagellar outer arm [Rhizoctonia solani]|uniref:Dynein alpha chain, flagellar outer arm n=1 Tax=Rhizoctonia solani TaxID=456999 RepID=A0A0K6FM31_9AGAM|nr:Dynein alpha chain, flagellar outer arm [Rhizoctonia solani]
MWIMFLRLSLGLCLLPCTQTQDIGTSNPLLIQPTPAELIVTSNLTVTSGGYDNYFYRSNLTSATLLLKNPSSINARTPNRMIVAHPAGNSGSLAYWLPYGNDASNLTVTLRPGSLSSAIGPNGLHGLQGTLLFSMNAELGPVQIGSVRQLRDYVEGGGLSQALFNYTVTQLDESIVWLTRRWLNDTTETLANGTTISRRYGYELRLQAENDTRFEVAASNNTSVPPIVRVLVPDNSPGRVSWTAQVNETHVPPLGVSEVFVSGPASNSSLNTVHEQFAFLTYQTKWMAGSWRFLTYFGRDTLLSTRLLGSARIISSSAIEAVIGAAIERLNYTDGRVAHEEAIGDYATFVNINDGHPERGNSVFLDYKMKDTHYLILPQLLTWALYNGTIDNTTINRFLDTRARLQPNYTYRALLDRNVQYIMNTSQAFAEDPANYRNLARIEEGISVGNWRDSNAGIGWGVYPVDISTALQPAALYAIADLAALGVLNNDLEATARAWGDTWESESPKFFKVAMNSSDAESQLMDYVQQKNLSAALLYGNGSLNDTTAPSTGASVTTPSNIIFYGLSLLEDGSVVQVMNSDLGFNLLYNRNISRELISAVIYALQPFPRGLLTNIGQLVANPAYDPNPTRISELDRAAYHGTVSWSWQTSLMALGLRRAVEACQSSDLDRTDLLRSGLRRPEWCDDATMTDLLLQARLQLNKSIIGSAPEIYSEVWSWTYGDNGRFSVVPLSELSAIGTETSAIQLWSFAALALGELS